MLTVEYAILNLSAGVDLVLKEKLKQEHWSLIFENVNKANSKDLQSGDFISVYFETILNRIEHVCGIIFPENEIQSLRTLRYKRNKIEHFHFQDNKGAIVSITSKVLSVIISFIKYNISEDTISQNSLISLNTIRQKLPEFENFVKLRMSQIKSDIENVEGKQKIIKCPRCLQETVKLADPIECFFCGYIDDPKSFGENYAIMFIKRNLPFLKDDVQISLTLERCFNCGASTLLEVYSEYICFSCHEIWHESSEVTRCPSCLRVCSVDEFDEGVELCNDCLYDLNI